MNKIAVDVQQRAIWQQLENEQFLADETRSEFADTLTIILLKVQIRLLEAAPYSECEEIRTRISSLIFRKCNNAHPLSTLLLLHISE
jgi:hypothetical protein